ncbi:MAG: DUF1579 domain-containing protein [Caldimonas sp.]
MRQILSLVVAVAGATWFAGASAQPRDPATLLAAETEAMKAFAMLDGAWRGPATVIQSDGTRLDFIQTERIGPLLGGSIRVIEGRGYDDNGAVRFNAFAIVSFDPASKSYSLHSHALGHVGDFAFVPTGDGYRWEIPLGPATIRYVATVKDGELHEVGERVVAGGAPMRIFEMRLKRIGDVDWPAAGAIAPK